MAEIRAILAFLPNALQADPTASTDPESVRLHLEGQLTALKCKVLQDFAEGGLRGEGLMAGIVALINDTRESLAGMMTVRNGARHGPDRDKVEQT